MTLDEATELLRTKAGEDSQFGATLLIEFDEGGCIFFQGKEVPNKVSNEAPEERTDLRIRLSLVTFEKIINKEVKGQRMLLTGKMKVRGDIRQAMKLDRVFGI